MRREKSKLLFVCAIVLLLGVAPVAQADWDEGDGHKMHYPQLPDPCGFDVAWDYDYVWSLGDDWQCSETGPVEDIHFWVSFENGVGGPEDIENFNVEIWSNNPGDSVMPWSHPEEPLWMYAHPTFTWRYVDTDWQGWFHPYWYNWWADDHIGCWQINIENIPDPFIQEEGEIYWLVINDVVTTDGVHMGWKESGSDQFMDDAVWLDEMWWELYDPETIPQESMDLAFVITGEQEPEPGIKWEQLPDLNDTGIDVDITYCGPAGDDFECTTSGPILDVHIWGSWLYDELPFWWDPDIQGDPTAMDFIVQIWSDNPMGPMGYSEPDELLWERWFSPGDFDVSLYADEIFYEGYYLPCEEYYYPQGDTMCWQYDFYIDPCEAFIQEGTMDEPVTYWLVVQAIPYDEVSFGWKTSLDKWNDDGVWGDGMMFWEELRYPLGHPFEMQSMDMAFMITGEEEPEPEPGIKWEQLPDLNDTGIDVDITWCGPGGDDFECTTSGPILDVHIWGSWLWDELPLWWEEPLFGDPTAMDFIVQIWSDNPMGPMGYSEPDELLWERWFMQGDFDVSLYAQDLYEGFYGPCEGYYEPFGDTMCWQYDFYIDPCEAFIQEGTMDGPVTYWLVVQALPYGIELGQVYFGWKTSLDKWNDDAVTMNFMPPPDWNELRYPIGHPFEMQSMDLAFRITTEEEPEPEPGIKWEQLPDLNDTGVDVDITWCGPVGDDFECTTSGPILDVHIWGSWLFDELPFWFDMPPGDPTAIDFMLQIWSDNPMGPMGWSEPNELLWEWWFQQGDSDVSIYASNLSEWYYMPCGEYGPDADWTCWQYDFYIDPCNAFIQEGDPCEPVTYWLVVQAFPHDGMSSFGWKTSLDHWNDDGVWGGDFVAMPWLELRYPLGHPFEMQSMDLAFRITGEEGGPELDFGDANDPTYPTLLASDGARHIIAGPWMGDITDAPDPEPDGQPFPPGKGDDLDGNDDEDGLILPNLTPGQAVNFNLEVNNALAGGAVVEIWIDYNINGNWDDAGELAYSALLLNGINAITINVPAGALSGMTFARARISNNGTGSPRGQASDGEVEDKKVYIEVPLDLDFGDAPDPNYPTFLASNGARHIIGGPWMGPGGILNDAPDPEPDGQPTPAADGDDLDGNDDEDGLTLPNLTPGQPANFILQVNNAPLGGAVVEIWIDYNIDGDWDDPGELAYSNSLPNGMNPITINVPAAALPGTTFARGRISSNGTGGSPRGQASDGEVEDTEVYIEEPPPPPDLDFGDANDPTYPTLLASNGARHIIAGPWMGDNTDVPDAEANGQPNASATGDDGDGNDDEDGLTLPTLTTGQAVNFNLEVNNASAKGAVVEIWIDYNINGDWDDAGELAYSNTLFNGVNAIIINVPAAAVPGMTFARARISSAGTGGSPRGQASDGEVEDTEVEIKEPPPPDLDFGDAPEDAMAYPSLLVFGAFPTCMNAGPAGHVQHTSGMARFEINPAPGWDAESDGDAGLCPPPGCFPPYDQDECFSDGDAGLMFPEPYTINAAGSVVPCPQCGGTPLGTTCQTAVWGGNVDIFVVNNLTFDVYVNVLMDWDQDGQWYFYSVGCPGIAWEHVLKNFVVPAGYTGPLSGLGPPNFVIGPNPGYIWTRFSVTEVSVPADKIGWNGEGTFEYGETEDYLLLVKEPPPPPDLDYGDAPDPTYPTLAANSGANHIIVPGVYLGQQIDAELDGQPTVGANGDDANNLDDEDGVTFLSPIIPGTTVDVNVVASANGFLFAWFDLNADGDWDDLGENIFAGQALNAGGNALQFNIPMTAPVGKTTYSRWRFVRTSAVGVSYRGQALDGEVEDYIHEIKEPPPKPLIKHSKWSQPPIELDPNSDIPVFCGWDERSLREWIEPIWFDCWDCPTQCHGDADCDGYVGPQDLIILNNAWPPNPPNPCADFNRDGVINAFDMNILLLNWDTYPPADCAQRPQYWTVAADDFRCLGTMPITSIHFWGSHYGWVQEEPGTTEPVPPIAWRIGFWSNVPAATTGDPNYSYPQKLLWQIEVDADRVEREKVGTDDFHHYHPNDICYQYTLYLEPNEYFRQGKYLERTRDNVFWLSIAAVYPEEGVDLKYPWGWKTRPWHWMDDAVRIWHEGPLEPNTVLDPYSMEPIKDPRDPEFGKSFDLAFELDTDPNYIKWEQHYTGIRHWPHYEDVNSFATVETFTEYKWLQRPDTSPEGMDVDATDDIWRPQLLADDFPCEMTGPIDRIHIWGSWFHDRKPSNDANMVAFTLSIHADIPDPDGKGPLYSMPGQLLWRRDFYPGDFEVFLYERINEGWYVPCAEPPLYDPSADTECWMYMFPIPPSEAFFQEQGNIYWLDVQAKPMLAPHEPLELVTRFGWKNTNPMNHFSDDAVWAVGTEEDFSGVTTHGPWQEMRYPPGHPWEGQSVDMAFEIFTYGTTKWAQPPEFTDINSIDIDATRDEIWQPQLLADDFNCTTTEPITDIHIWGSWYHDFLPYGDPGMVRFKLSIHKDIPADESPTEYSMPGELLWEKWFEPGEFDVNIFAEDLDEGYYVPCSEPPYYERIGDHICWQYDFYINESEAFVQEGTEDAPVVYWLNVQAVPLTPPDQPIEPMRPRFGWKTTDPGSHWNDDAVWAVGTEQEHSEWQELRHPETGETLDLAFAITTSEKELITHRRVADDWKCERHTPVTAAVWWGSYLGFEYWACHGQQMPPPEKPDYFLLSIWTDVPDPNPADPSTFSHPNDIIWEYKAYDYDEVLVGYDKHPHDPAGGATGPPREPVFRYSVQLPRDEWFRQKDVNGIYWFSVVAVYEKPLAEIEYTWGWTNHEHVFNDDAAAWEMDTSGLWNWVPLKDQTGKTEDMSFILYTEPGCFPSWYTTYFDWLALGKPNCWCGIYGTPPWPYQCDGDADGLDSGFPTYYQIYTSDLNLLIIANWKKTISDPTLNPCADIDHKDSGFPTYYRVYTADLQKLLNNWKRKASPDLPADCPRPE